MSQQEHSATFKTKATVERAKADKITAQLSHEESAPHLAESSLTEIVMLDTTTDGKTNLEK